MLSKYIKNCNKCFIWNWLILYKRQQELRNNIRLLFNINQQVYNQETKLPQIDNKKPPIWFINNLKTSAEIYLIGELQSYINFFEIKP